MENQQINCSNCSKLVPHNNFCGECASKLPIIDNCPICLNTISLETTPCGHNVCNDCVSKLKKNGNTCHICRKSLGNWKNVQRTLFLCPTCNSQDHRFWTENNPWSKTSIYDCKNCKQTFHNLLQISEEQIAYYPVLDKEDVNPAMVSVCDWCFNTKFDCKIDFWGDVITDCISCNRFNIDVITITKNEQRLQLIDLQ